MPVTPAAAARQRDSRLRADLEVVTKSIDTFLSAVVPTAHREWWYSTRKIPGDLVDAVVTAYKLAGWDVRIDATDPREPAALVFKEK